MWQLICENNQICQQINKLCIIIDLIGQNANMEIGTLSKLCSHQSLLFQKEQNFWPVFCTAYFNLKIKELILSSGPQTIGRVYEHWPLPPDVCHHQWTNCHCGGVPFQSELQEYDLLDFWRDQGDQANNSSPFIPVLSVGPSQDFIKTERYYLRLNWNLKFPTL